MLFNALNTKDKDLQETIRFSKKCSKKSKCKRGLK